MKTREPIDKRDLSYDEWIKIRTSYIGASEVRGILGLTSYPTRYEVWENRVKPDDPTVRARNKEIDSNPRVRMGRYFEPAVATAFAHEFGFEVKEDPYIRFHPKLDILGANLDRLTKGPATDEWVPLEIKTTGARNVENWKVEGLENEMYQGYWSQLQVQIAVYGNRTLGILVACGGSDFSGMSLPEPFEERFDPNFEEYVLDEVNDFWKNHILKEDPPEKTIVDLKSKWMRDAGSEVEGDLNLVRRAIEYQTYHQQIKDIDKLKQEAGESLKLFMQENAILTYQGERILTYKNNKDKVVFDEQAFQRRYPREYEEAKTAFDLLTAKKLFPSEVQECTDIVPGNRTMRVAKLDALQSLWDQYGEPITTSPLKD